VDTPSIQPYLASIRIHPIKSLDPISLPSCKIAGRGGLRGDRVWAMYDAKDKWIRGKSTPAVHQLRSSYDLSTGAVNFTSVDSPAPVAFRLPEEASRASAWLSSYFGESVTLRHSPEGFPDDTDAPGPTVISTATLEAVCGWFPGLTLDRARERFRANLEISSVPAFWEDRLFAADAATTVRFRIGDVLVEGVNPCVRCVVPSRDPHTAAVIESFQVRFTAARTANLPAWSPAGRFDHFYRLAVNTRIPPAEWGKTVRVGDPVSLL
jgi:uncharacterized protein